MNPNALIVVADAARARLLRVAETEAPRAPFTLREIASLVHPEARIKEGERHSGSFPAGVRSGKVGGGHTLNDHRAAHDAEERRRFAKAIAQAASRAAAEQSLNPVIVIATHAIHALLMAEIEPALPKNVYLRSELGELSEHSPRELFSELAQRGLFQP